MIYRYLSYTLTLGSPAILSALGGDPNSSSTLLFIPGPAVRGALAKALGDPGRDGAKQQEFSDLVLGGRVRYLNVYPSAGGRRTFPMPLSLRREKNKAEESQTVAATDIAAFDGHCTDGHDLSACWPEEQLTSLGEAFISIGGGKPVAMHPTVSARIHHQRDRRKGRAWKDQEGTTHGAIFTFESLDAGQTFQGLIQIRGETDEACRQAADRIRELLGDTLLVGRSRRAGYGGLAVITWGEVRDREVRGAGSEGLRPVTEDIAEGETFRLLLISACIVRNPQTGQMDPEALTMILQKRFSGPAKLLRKRWAFEIVGGFNRKWRLETPQVPAVSAGSVFVFEAVQDIPFAELQQIEHEGLGERREEGFGRVLFLDAPLQRLNVYKPEDDRMSQDRSGEPPDLVREIEQRILSRRVAKKIEEEAAKLLAQVKHLPTNSLIGRLRLPLRKGPDEAIETLQRWLDGHQESERLKRPAMEQLERCRLDGGQTLKDWLLAASRQENIVQWIQPRVLANRHHISSEETAGEFLRDEWKRWALLLMDAVLAGLALRNKREEGNDG
ncbi:MAG: hypothetical protein GX443_14765 [Deltaproteobacteria bacterium]|nr:hypothetical protein [Deltaproteobacteria bacterium]